jgi:hypothetical protein
VLVLYGNKYTPNSERAGLVLHLWLVWPQRTSRRGNQLRALGFVLPPRSPEASEPHPRILVVSSVAGLSTRPTPGLSASLGC